MTKGVKRARSEGYDAGMMLTTLALAALTTGRGGDRGCDKGRGGDGDLPQKINGDEDEVGVPGVS